MERAFKGIWIPKEIWLSEDLNIMEKLFLVEIDSLDNDHGCFASNDYFSKFFKLSKNRCSEIIKSLEEKKYILISYKYRPGTKQIEKRILRATSKYLDVRKTEYIGIRKTDEVVGKSIRWSGNTEDNNTPLIIHSNNSSSSEAGFKKNNLLSIEELYKNNIGKVNQTIKEWLIELSDVIDIDLFKEAINRYTFNGGKTPKYFKSIIESWLQNSVTNLDQLRAFELQNKFSTNSSVSKNNNNIQNSYKKGAGANVNNSFAGYAPDELEKILLESQKGKFD